MGKNNCKAVWFNPEALTLYDELKKEGLVSQSFIHFVKDAFHDKVDSIRIKQAKKQ